MKEKIKALQESPLYNLSLCSKEEFHSAFFVWFLNLDIQKNIKVFFGENANVDKNAKAHREIKFDKHSRADIIIGSQELDKNGVPKVITYIIENKFKCFPSNEQFKKYDEQMTDLENDKKLLVTLFEPNYKYRWQAKSYLNIIEKIKSQKDESDYFNSLISDYCNYIELLYSILSSQGEEPSDKTILKLFKNHKYLEICNKILADVSKNTDISQFNFEVVPKADRLTFDLTHLPTGYGIGLHFVHSGKIEFYNFISGDKAIEDLKKGKNVESSFNWLLQSVKDQEKQKVQIKKQLSKNGNIVWIRQDQSIKASAPNKADAILDILRNGLLKAVSEIS